LEDSVTANEYLASVLRQQSLSDFEITGLRGLRDQIQKQLSVFQGNPRFYYAGSYGKHTMIRQRYDLDIVVYWPSGVSYTIKGIYDAVGQELRKHWTVVNSKTVSWELPFDGGFHIDVVPGRALDTTFKEANLYRTDTGTTLKTSLKTHIDCVSQSGRRDAIRVMKLWRERQRVPYKKSLLLEVMTISGCSGTRFDDLSAQVWAALHYVRDNIRTCNVLDPANSNNSLSDDLTGADREGIYKAAYAATQARDWSQIV
jgi:hypothetical protein